MGKLQAIKKATQKTLEDFQVTGDAGRTSEALIKVIDSLIDEYNTDLSLIDQTRKSSVDILVTGLEKALQTDNVEEFSRLIFSAYNYCEALRVLYTTEFILDLQHQKAS
jgi:hypothetical protein